MVLPSLFVLLFGIVSAGTAAPTTVPVVLTETRYAAGFEKPTAMLFLPDGRLLVSVQTGEVWSVPQGGGSASLLLAVDTRADYTGRGLLGLVLDPGFTANGYLYLYYTRFSDGEYRNVIERVTLVDDAVEPDSAVTLVTLDPQVTNRHNGGTLRFGPDGMLYLGVGDNAVPAHAQSLHNRFGKILRYHPDGSIPLDNPFFNRAEGENRAIWALGLRNPYTFDFEPLGGDLYINDVGEDSWEEVNVGAPGDNFGWPQVEGPETLAPYRPPLYAFSHQDGRCAATGALFYTGSRFPAEVLGDYLFAELCTSTIYALDPRTSLVAPLFVTAALNPIDLDLGADGAVYVLGYADGVITKLSYDEIDEQ